MHIVLQCIQCNVGQYLSLSFTEQVSEPLVPQGPVREVCGTARTLHGLLQPQFELPKRRKLIAQLPLSSTTGLEVQLQVQRCTRGLLSQRGAVGLLRSHQNTHKLGTI